MLSVLLFFLLGLTILHSLDSVTGFVRRNFRELLLLTALFIAFLVVNPLIQYLAPGSGALDWSFLTLLVAGLFKAVFIVCGVWLMLAIFFPTVGRHMDSGGFRSDFGQLIPEHRLVATGLTVLLLTALLTVCVLWG